MYLNQVRFRTHYYILAIFGCELHTYDFNFNKFLMVGCSYEYEDKLTIITKKVKQKYRFELCSKTLYKIPYTLTIAYNETHLFSPDIRENCAHIYAALECKDPFVIIADFLFELLINDYSLYKCANL
jgi:hypothetical protein